MMGHRGRVLVALVVLALGAGFLIEGWYNPFADPLADRNQQAEFDSPWLPQPTPNTTPHEVETPQVEWVDGIVPSSDLEDHPLVRAARMADLGRAVAWNTGDFDSTLVMEHNSAAIIANLADSYGRQGDSPYVHVIAYGWQPLEIRRYDEFGGELMVCDIGTGRGTMKTGTEPGGWFERSDRTAVSFLFLNDHGTYRYYAQGTRWSDKCDGSTIPVAFFDPEPELPPTPVTKPVYPPPFDGWDDPSFTQPDFDEPDS